MKILPRLLVPLLAFAVITEAHAMRWYSPNTGHWLSRDPIGEKGGANLSAFGRNDMLNAIDPRGLEIKNYDYIEFNPPSGTFEVKLMSGISVGDRSLDGFQLRYHRSEDPPCPCPKKKKLIMVQAIDGPAYSTMFDTTDKVRAEHWKAGGDGLPIPEMPNPKGYNEPESVTDAPWFSTENNGGTWKIEVCAICRLNFKGVVTDMNLGCIRFDFKRDGKGCESLDVTGGSPGASVAAKSPTSLWKDAFEAWKKDGGSGKKF